MSMETVEDKNSELGIQEGGRKCCTQPAHRRCGD